MKITDEFGIEHNYREKWNPYHSDYDEYWMFEDAYNCHQFYEISELNDERVLFEFYKGNTLLRTREVPKNELRHYELAIGDDFSYREKEERKYFNV